MHRSCGTGQRACIEPGVKDRSELEDLSSNIRPRMFIYGTGWREGKVVRLTPDRTMGVFAGNVKPYFGPELPVGVHKRAADFSDTKGSKWMNES